MINEKYPDRYRIYDYYKEYVVESYFDEDFKKMFQKTETADVINVHDAVVMVIRMGIKYRSTKTTFLEYLGTDFRGFDRNEDRKNFKYKNKLVYTKIRFFKK